MEKLAVNGGVPVRRKPFPSNYLGVTLYDDKEMAELADVIQSKSPFRHYGLGNPCKVAEFEAKAREYFGRKYALAVSSGTGSLFCAVVALDIGPGDEVILPSFGWYSNYFAITNAGALPAFADIDETLSLDPHDFERKITKNTKAVMIVDFQGCPANMDKIMRIAKEHNIKVIEDIAQAVGGEYNGKKLGAFGDIGMASFQQNKILCCGEGGIFLTDNGEYFARAVRYHDLSIIRPIFAEQIKDKALLEPSAAFAGSQFRMSEFQGAVMLAQLRKLEYILETCRRYHARVRESFRTNTHFRIRYVEGDCGITIFMLFPTKDEAVKFESCLKAEGIPTGAKSACKNLMPEYPVKSKKLTHAAMPPFGKGFSGEDIDYSVCNADMQTDTITSRYVATSIGPLYTDDDIADIINAIRKVDENLY